MVGNTKYSVKTKLNMGIGLESHPMLKGTGRFFTSTAMFFLKTSLNPGEKGLGGGVLVGMALGYVGWSRN